MLQSPHRCPATARLNPLDDGAGGRGPPPAHMVIALTGRCAQLVQSSLAGCRCSPHRIFGAIAPLH